MIHTGLPYRMEEITEIAQNGAVVNMDSLSFPTIPEDKQISTAFIFLRNTGFPLVSLDFSRCSYEKKEAYLQEYLETDMLVKYEEFSDTVIAVLDSLFFQNTGNMESFLVSEECQKFISRNKKLLLKLLQFLASVPVYALYRLKLNGEAYSLSDIPETEVKIGINYLNLLSYEDMQYIMFHTGLEPLFYTKIFTEDNNELFSALSVNGLGIMETLLGFE